MIKYYFFVLSVDLDRRAGDYFNVNLQLLSTLKGYRPILDAMKTFCVDPPAHLKKAVVDIEVRVLFIKVYLNAVRHIAQSGES